MAIALVVVLRSGGDDGTRPAAPAPPPTEAPATDPLFYPSAGLRLARPVDWTAAARDDTIRLRAVDRTAAVTIAVVPRRIGPAALRRTTERAVRRSLRRVRSTGRSVLALGGQATDAVEFSARTTDGAPLDVVMAAVRSRWRTYAVTVFRGRGSAPARLAEISAVLASMRFGRPERAG